jgi:hypothetical protein
VVLKTTSVFKKGLGGSNRDTDQFNDVASHGVSAVNSGPGQFDTSPLGMSPPTSPHAGSPDRCVSKACPRSVPAMSVVAVSLCCVASWRGTPWAEPPLSFVSLLLLLLLLLLTPLPYFTHIHTHMHRNTVAPMPPPYLCPQGKVTLHHSVHGSLRAVRALQT